MGKSASKASQALSSQAANRFSDLSSQLSSEAAPGRALVNSTYSNIIKGGPAAYSSIAPQVDFAKQQYQNARQTVRDTAPAGGAFNTANNTLANGEAQTVSNLYRDNINNALNGLNSSSQSSTGQALGATSGVSGIAQQLQQLAQQRSAAFTGGLGGIAGALGTLFAGGFGGGGGGMPSSFSPGMLN